MYRLLSIFFEKEIKNGTSPQYFCFFLFSVFLSFQQSCDVFCRKKKRRMHRKVHTILSRTAGLNGTAVYLQEPLQEPLLRTFYKQTYFGYQRTQRRRNTREALFVCVKPPTSSPPTSRAHLLGTELRYVLKETRYLVDCRERRASGGEEWFPSELGLCVNMPVGESNFDRLTKSALKWRPESAERTAWAQVFFSLLTQARYL